MTIKVDCISISRNKIETSTFLGFSLNIFYSTISYIYTHAIYIILGFDLAIKR